MKTTRCIQYHLSTKCHITNRQEKCADIDVSIYDFEFSAKDLFPLLSNMQINRNILTAEARFGSNLGHVIFVGDKVTLW
jgi:hypothetical protein